PTGVHSISGDGYVIVQWNDLVYAPYDGAYSANLVSYEVYRRGYSFGDENDPDRTFDPLEVLNPFEGQPSAEVDARHGDVYTGVGPPYEQPRDIVARTVRFFLLARRRHPGGNVVAVTHGDVIVFAMLWARGLALTPQNKAGLHTLGFTDGYPATGSLTAFTFRTDWPRELPEVRYFKP
ncbi:MAG: histidine phosphatase family protein, partial [Chloroflexi bacterium]|nr:histidine phosphatase family protein [Chloroflexota bacterium]